MINTQKPLIIVETTRPKLPLTTYTSFLFALVSHIAYTKQVWLSAVLWNFMCAMSVLNHAKVYDDYIEKRYVFIVDYVVVHCAIITSMIFAVTEEIILISKILYWLALMYGIIVYHIFNKSYLPGNLWIPWHASLHVMGCFGQCALLLGYNH